MSPSGATAILLVVLLAACAEPTGSTAPSGTPGSTEPTESTEPAPADPTGTAWELESGTLDGGAIPIVDGHPINLSFTNQGMGGTAACNGYGGSYVLSGTGINFSELAQTDMACMPEETMESEQMYLAALIRVDALSMGEDRLIFVGDGIELVYIALPPVPTAELTGTVWVLDGLIQGDAVSTVSGERATLELFSDGSMLGSTGCRDLNGTYRIIGAEVLMTDMTAAGDCPAQIQDQDDLVVTVLGDGFRVEIDDDTLILTGPGNVGLVYTAAS